MIRAGTRKIRALNPERKELHMGTSFYKCLGGSRKVETQNIVAEKMKEGQRGECFIQDISSTVLQELPKMHACSHAFFHKLFVLK